MATNSGALCDNSWRPLGRPGTHPAREDRYRRSPRWDGIQRRRGRPTGRRRRSARCSPSGGALRKASRPCRDGLRRPGRGRRALRDLAVSGGVSNAGDWGDSTRVASAAGSAPGRRTVKELAAAVLPFAGRRDRAAVQFNQPAATSVSPIPKPPWERSSDVSPCTNSSNAVFKSSGVMPTPVSITSKTAWSFS